MSRFCRIHMCSGHNTKDCPAAQQEGGGNDNCEDDSPRGPDSASKRQRQALTNSTTQAASYVPINIDYQYNPSQSQQANNSTTQGTNEFHIRGQAQSSLQQTSQARPTHHQTLKTCDYCGKPNHQSDDCQRRLDDFNLSWKSSKIIQDVKQYSNSGRSEQPSQRQTGRHVQQQPQHRSHAHVVHLGESTYCATCLFPLPVRADRATQGFRSFLEDQAQTRHEQQCAPFSAGVATMKPGMVARGLSAAQMLYLTGMVPACMCCNVVGWRRDGDGEAIMWGVGLASRSDGETGLADGECWIVAGGVAKVVLCCACAGKGEKDQEKAKEWRHGADVWMDDGYAAVGPGSYAQVDAQVQLPLPLGAPQGLAGRPRRNAIG